MSTNGETPWGLWVRQILAVLRLELLRAFLGKRAVLLYLLAGVALMPFLARAITVTLGFQDKGETADSIQVYAVIWNVLVLRISLFLGSVWVFMNLIRGDILDRTLHLYFLSPVRRDVLIAAKFVAGLAVTIPVFCTVTLLTHILTYALHGEVFSAALLGHLAAYLSATATACLGYGALFLLIGMLVRNPVIPALAVAGWEFLNPFLPALLKKISVVHYVTSLTPVRPPEGALAILANPTPWYFSLPGLLLFTAAVLWIGSKRVRRLEISYGGD